MRLKRNKITCTCHNIFIITGHGLIWWRKRNALTDGLSVACGLSKHLPTAIRVKSCPRENCHFSTLDTAFEMLSDWTGQRLKPRRNASVCSAILWAMELVCNPTTRLGSISSWDFSFLYISWWRNADHLFKKNTHLYFGYWIWKSIWAFADIWLQCLFPTLSSLNRMLCWVLLRSILA